MLELTDYSVLITVMSDLLKPFVLQSIQTSMLVSSDLGHMNIFMSQRHISGKMGSRIYTVSLAFVTFISSFSELALLMGRFAH